MTDTTQNLPELTSQERLQAYQLIVDGCKHVWSKGKLQKDRAEAVLNALMPLTKNDPFFLAHLTSYAYKNLDGKDLKIFLAFASALSVADGQPFSPGLKYLKPNLRPVSWSAVNMLDPKMVEHLTEIASMKFEVKDHYNMAKHFPPSLRTAIKKYIKYRESNPEIVVGIKKAGLANFFSNTYRKLSIAPSDEVAKILRWQQKDHKIEFEKSLIDFKDLDDLQIAEKIRTEKIPYMGVLGGLTNISKKVTPVIAVAMLEQASGNQAVIMRATFEDSGILNDPEVMKLYEEKIQSAKTTLDRAETVSKNASDAVKQALSKARATSRQATTAGIGKVFVHLDFSGSMSAVQQYASERGSILAECVNDPANNFAWGAFGGRGVRLPLPKEFVKDAFAQVLFMQSGLGSTDCFALYDDARKFGADVDVFISDQQHTDGNLERKIKDYHAAHPEIMKPRACVIINFGRGKGTLADAYEDNGIPVVLIDPNTLTQSAQVATSVKTAMLGPVALVDEIMNTELLKLPNWYYTI